MQNRTREEIAAENKDIALRCPITKEYFRHPILASDGRHYELEFFLTWVSGGNTKSPTTTLPLKHAAYDHHFKKKIDNLIRDKKIADAERYSDYDATQTLKQLHTFIPESPTWENDITYSTLTSFGAILLLAVMNLIVNCKSCDEPEKLIPDVILYATAIFTVDFVLRSASQHQFGLLTLFRKAAAIAEHLPTTQHIRDLEGFFDRPHPAP